MSGMNPRVRVVLAFVTLLVFCGTTNAQKRSSSENRIAKLENEVNTLSEKIKTLEARLSVLEQLRAFRSPEELRHAMIEACRDAIINHLNNLAADAYQFRIRPATMGGGGGIYTGFTIPRRLASDDNAEYQSV